VESTNKTLEGIITETVAMNRKNWEEKLKDASGLIESSGRTLQDLHHISWCMEKR